MRAVAILVAAGSGARLGSGLPKALVPLDGVPLVARAASALLASGAVGRLVVTAPAGHLDAVRAALALAMPGTPDDVAPVVVPGGPSRQASVRAGLDVVAALPGVTPATVVLVHDAARPLVPADVVLRVVEAVEAGRSAVVPGLAPADTLKQVGPDDDGAARVTATPARAGLRAVQTPQGFTVGTLVMAHEAGAARADDEALAATDDAALVEALGLDVWVVAGHEDAAKITTARDLLVAELALRGRGGAS